FEQAEVRRLREQSYFGDRRKAVFLDADAPLAAGGDVLVQRFPDVELFLRQYEQPGSIAIQAVRQLEHLRFRTRSTQRLDHPEAHAAAAVDRDAGRFVDHEQGGVFEGDREAAGLGGRSGDRSGNPHRRQPDLVAEPQAIVRLDAPAVDPDLAAAQDTIDVTLRHAFQPAQQEIVDAL